jgi:hypothetical protein
MMQKPRHGTVLMVCALTLGACSARAFITNGVVDASVIEDRSVPADQVTPVDVSVDRPAACATQANADLLFVIDNSNSMAENQANLVRNFGTLLHVLTVEGEGRAITSLHVGVVSSDLGTPGSVVPSCANSDVGDDGILNPVRNGLAIRTHQPWTTAPPGRLPARCTNDPNKFPNFLRFDASASTSTTELRDDFICNAYLSIGGCGLEQQLESAYRALVVRNPRSQVGNTDPNAGFVRDDAVLGVFFVTDEEDMSTRDCRYAEMGVSCTEAVSVFDIMSDRWSSNDLNLRGYMYTPGSAQDPTWRIDRYVDPMRPNRGFTSLKPGRPELVVVGALAGVPMALTQPGQPVDWNMLLGTDPLGSDGYVGMSPEGPVSMRQRNMDPMCATRVVAACRREGSTRSATCDLASQYFAWPSRRIAQVVRHFDERYGNGVIGSICRNDSSPTLLAFGQRVRSRVCR